MKKQIYAALFATTILGVSATISVDQVHASVRSDRVAVKTAQKKVTKTNKAIKSYTKKIKNAQGYTTSNVDVTSADPALQASIASAQTALNDAQNQVKVATVNVQSAQAQVSGNGASISANTGAIVAQAQKAQASAQSALNNANASISANQAKIASDQTAIQNNNNTIANLQNQANNNSQASSVASLQSQINSLTAARDAKVAQLSNNQSQGQARIVLPQGTNVSAMSNWTTAQWNSWAKGVSVQPFVDNATDQANTVNVNNMSASQSQDLQNYFGSLLNDVLVQAGQQKAFVNNSTVNQYAQEIANGYTADASHFVLTMSHDNKAINAVSQKYNVAIGENISAGLDTSGIYGNVAQFNGTTNMNDIKKAIYTAMSLMIDDDDGAGWSHAAQFFGLAANVQTPNAIWSVVVDGLGQIHFIVVYSATKPDSLGINQYISVAGSNQPMLDVSSASTSNNNAAVQSEVNDLNTQIANAKAQLKSASANTGNANKVADQIKTLTSSNTRLQNEINALNNAISNTNAQLSGLQATLDSANAALTNAQAISNSASVTTPSDNQAATAALTNAQSKLADAKKAEAAAQAKLNSLTSQVRHTTTSVKHARVSAKYLKSLKKHLAYLRKLIKKQRKALAAAKHRLAVATKHAHK